MRPAAWARDRLGCVRPTPPRNALLARLRAGRPESIETSSLHLDVLRDLKRIYSHICSVAYPVLEAAGELQPSRLKESDVAAADDMPSDLLRPPPQSS